MDKNAQTERLAALFNMFWTEERFNFNDGNQDYPNATRTEPNAN